VDALAGSLRDLPVNDVTWYQAYAFCIWDGGFLPSEAEWNYRRERQACRACCGADAGVDRTATAQRDALRAEAEVRHPRSRRQVRACPAGRP